MTGVQCLDLQGGGSQLPTSNHLDEPADYPLPSCLLQLLDVRESAPEVRQVGLRLNQHLMQAGLKRFLMEGAYLEHRMVIYHHPTMSFIVLHSLKQPLMTIQFFPVRSKFWVLTNQRKLEFGDAPPV